MKIWEHKNEGKESNFSIGFTVEDEDQITMFEQIEQRIRTLAEKAKPSLMKMNPKLKLHRDSLVLLKQCLKVYPKLYLKNGEINCIFNQKVGEKSKKKLDPHSIIGVPFKRIIIMKLRKVFLSNIKTISLVGKEVLVKDIIHPQSYFDEYEDVEDAETEK